MGRRALLVLGMHRSGTSALAGVSCALGVSPPKNLMLPNDDNPRGYWESLPLVRAHDEFLASVGSSWDDWKRLDSNWFGSQDAIFFKDRIRTILESEFDDSALFVVKDPRICRFLPLFIAVLVDMAISPVAIFALRNPLEVAFSLRRRNGFPIAKSIAIWLRHVLEAEQHSRAMPRHFVKYERLLKDWRVEMHLAGDSIGVIWPADTEISAKTIEEFLSVDLYHQKSGLEQTEEYREVAFLASEVYCLLCAMASGQQNDDLFVQMDSLRTRFNEVCDFFGAILIAEEAIGRQLRAQLSHKSEHEKNQLLIQIDQLKRQVKEPRSKVADGKLSKKQLDDVRRAADRFFSKEISS